MALSLALWIGTAYLISPMWRWAKLAGGQAQIEAAWFSLYAALFVPLTIGLSHRQEAQHRFQPQTWREWFIVLYFKLWGAFFGFIFLLILVSLPILLLFTLWRFTLPDWILWGLAILPPFFSYVYSLRFTADRYRRSKGKPTLIRGELIFLIVLVLNVGWPWVAYFLYLYILPEPFYLFALLVASIGLALWEWHKQDDSPFQDRQILWLLGLVFPLALIVMVVLLVPSDLEVEPFIAVPILFTEGELDSNWILLWGVLLRLSYFFTGWMLWLTVQLRQYEQLSGLWLFDYAMSFLVFLWLLVFDRYAMGWGIYTAVYLIILVQNRLVLTKPQAYIHPSILIIVLAITFSSLALRLNWIALEINLFLFVSGAALLLIWAFNPSGSSNSNHRLALKQAADLSHFSDESQEESADPR